MVFKQLVVLKMTMIFYLAGYLVRQQISVKQHIFGFIKPMIVLGLISVLLLMEPDFGATVVISGTVMAKNYPGE